MNNHCNRFFNPGLLTTIMDVGAGSSGKGKIGSYIASNQNIATFAVNTYHPQAGHNVVLDDGRQFFYQSLNSCAYLLGDNLAAGATSLQKLYIAPGAMIELPALLREIQENRLQPHQLGISPVVPILDADIDGGFEQGRKGFDGAEVLVTHAGTAKFGSTGHGVGSCNARRILRRESLRLAKDIPELQPYICDVPHEIRQRLENGESGLLEIAQGYQLSLMLADFYPFTTSRNVTVAQALSDCMLPTRYAGQVIGNLRTFPIRINSNKYIALEDGRHLTWAEVQAGVPHTVYHGNSGTWWPDQQEISWEQITKDSGSPTPIQEITSVTKLPRRVATFSRENVVRWVQDNDTGHEMTLSLNFVNYVDAALTGARTIQDLQKSEKFQAWAKQNLANLPPVRFFGTGAETESMIYA